jgi:hypothetical protein
MKNQVTHYKNLLTAPLYLYLRNQHINYKLH